MAGPLSAEEIAHFKEWGFVVKRNYLSPELCAKARDWVWENSESAATSIGRSGKPMDRHDRDTWVGPFTPDEKVVEHQKELWEGGNAEMEYLNSNRWIVHQFGSAKEFIDVLPRRMMPVAEQLLGQPCVKPVVGAPTNAVNWGWERGGGVHGCGMYATVPMIEGEGEGCQKRVGTNAAGGLQLGLHVDGLACSLGCVGYIDDVPEDGGGFAIYPGCHRRMYHAFENRHAVTTTDAYTEVQKLCGDYQRPYVFTGSCGDVIIYHHRMFHSATQNLTGSTSKDIRMALFYDFVTEELASLFPKNYDEDENSAERPPGMRSSLADGPPPADMWEGWSAEVREAPEPPPLPVLGPPEPQAQAGSAKL